ncbi:CPBP family intramembrane metalloprotease [Plantibacter sp. VKM Ac-2885]|uniref:CPBP family intramembrane glutamic endopeptidase n=1 Tax=Plantibacter sp. VKM Ac-2885 TaxID=2783828 RepID=UPI00188C4CD8|nr:CPBP family intramembrane glutamic endopeptidase [Plantibacter sp. VKM Ac-2885]MBF4514115.1 CPBP family intramembrane metalloprotease [Plantibacter sp. VKM Ac-2885]
MTPMLALVVLTCIAILSFGVYAVGYYGIKRRPVLRSLGLTCDRWLPSDVAIGLAIAFSAIALVFVSEVLMGAISVRPGTLTWASFVPDVLVPLALAAAIEETVFRVLLLGGMAVVLSRLRHGRWVAVLLTGALFGAMHLGNEGATAVSAVGTGLGGVIYGVAFLATRSVWLPFGLHLGWNLSQGLFGLPISGHVVPGWFASASIGPDVLSGAAYGPEGGIPGMLARVLVIVLVFVYMKKRWPLGSIATLSFAPDPKKAPSMDARDALRVV